MKVMNNGEIENGDEEAEEEEGEEEANYIAEELYSICVAWI